MAFAPRYTRASGRPVDLNQIDAHRIAKVGYRFQGRGVKIFVDNDVNVYVSFVSLPYDNAVIDSKSCAQTWIEKPDIRLKPK